MLGQPISMLIPEIVGFKLTGKLREGVTATDLVLTVTQMLRKKGVVGKFVEYYGPGLDELSLEDRATIANMAPEYGATCGFFPIDAEAVRFPQEYRAQAGPRRAGGEICQGAGVVAQRQVGRSGVHRHAEPGHDHGGAQHGRSDAAAGPRVPVGDFGQLRRAFDQDLKKEETASKRAKLEGSETSIGHGDVVIAAITSCTNTSNPSVMIGPGLVAQSGGEARLEGAPLGEDLARARLAGRSRIISPRPAWTRRWTSSASPLPAMAAPPASAIQARCRSRWPRR
jgi:aconitate hydratase